VVSVLTAAQFAAHAQPSKLFHTTLASCAGSYAATEAANSSTLG